MAFAIASDTYPSNAYFEKQVNADGNNVGVLYIPLPDTSDKEGIMFCNIGGDNDSGHDFVIDVEPGGVLYNC